MQPIKKISTIAETMTKYIWHKHTGNGLATNHVRLNPQNIYHMPAAARPRITKTVGYSLRTSKTPLKKAPLYQPKVSWHHDA